MTSFVSFTQQHLEKYLPNRYNLTIEADLEREDLSPIFAEKIELATSPDSWNSINANYVILGIPEDIGVRANMGRPGADKAWSEFLNVFLSQPHNSFNDATRFCVLGNIYTADLMKEAADLDAGIHADRIKLSNLVMLLDKRVSEVLFWVKSAGKIPIIIGGGHNNCYPIIRTFGYDSPINCINIDTHTDLRPTTGRHSGNGFSHAIEQGFLNHYHMIGVQPTSFTATMEKIMDNSEKISYEALSDTMASCVDRLNGKLNLEKYGLEIDLDVIANFPSSAQSSIGLSINQVQNIFRNLIEKSKPEYIHICEGAPEYGYKNEVGKTISSLLNILGQ
ncbi:hypothetical protein BST97_03790 [Nonlabens spongiae]|uniref:Arginase n=1 Tax=Nonlabens spongiae TaxID=331648 RepID=A0A1W6MI90_9FLAO|nr:arginase family protein [Nonlabens spongiae]ARN77179.1 hypothetical protein BST97_03790 [Nonlabens spongiae]